MSTKKDTASITARVIKDAALELREATDRIKSISQDLEDLQERANKDFEPLAVAVQEAEAEVRAHERYKDHLPRQEWDAENRDLQKVLDAAIRERDAFRDQARAQAKPLQDRLREAVEERQGLEAEWRVHARTAKVAGIDVDDLLDEEEE